MQLNTPPLPHMKLNGWIRTPILNVDPLDTGAKVVKKDVLNNFAVDLYLFYHVCGWIDTLQVSVHHSNHRIIHLDEFVDVIRKRKEISEQFCSVELETKRLGMQILYMCTGSLSSLSLETK